MEDSCDCISVETSDSLSQSVGETPGASASDRQTDFIKFKQPQETGSIVGNSPSQDSTNDITQMKKMRRMRRVEIIRKKRKLAPRDPKIAEELLERKTAFLCTNVSFNVGSVSSCRGNVSKLQERKQKNRESAERSRLNRENTIDYLTCLVCEQYVQLEDAELRLENLRRIYSCFAGSSLSNGPTNGQNESQCIFSQVPYCSHELSSCSATSEEELSSSDCTDAFYESDDSSLGGSAPDILDCEMTLDDLDVLDDELFSYFITDL